MKRTENIFILLLAVLALLSCDNAINGEHTSDILIQDRISDFWLPVKYEQRNKATKEIITTVHFSGNNALDWSVNSCRNIFLSLDKWSGASSAACGYLKIGGIIYEILWQCDTLVLIDKNINFCEDVLYLLKWNDIPPKNVCIVTGGGVALPYDSLPTRRLPE